MLLLGVEKIRHNARLSFANTISGTDLIVGGRSGSVQLLLYTIFRIGNATSDIDWQSYEEIAALPGVSWTVPLTLGDSHRGFRVIGTNVDYFRYYRYGGSRPLQLAQGELFENNMDMVIGAKVAEDLGYQIGDPVVVNHGLKGTDYSDHDETPFRITGILKATGTPVDKSLHISLQGVEAMHDQKDKIRDIASLRKRRAHQEGETESITALLVGLESKSAAFKIQRYINQYPNESLIAIFPGVALHELWRLMAPAEKALLIISSFVVATSLIGMLSVSLAGLNERRREIAILRSLGANQYQIMGLLVVESTLLTLTGIVTGILLLYVGLFTARPFIETHYGLSMPLSWPGLREFYLISILLLAGILVGLIPAWRAYHNSLLDGLSARI